MKKEYPINMHKPHYKLKAKRIKDNYAKYGFDPNAPAFICGNTIAYSMEEDLQAMQSAIRFIRDFCDDIMDDNDEFTGSVKMKYVLLQNAIRTLKKRIDDPDNLDEKRYESTEKKE